MTDSIDARTPFSREEPSLQKTPASGSGEDAALQETALRAPSFRAGRTARGDRRAAPDGHARRPSLLEDAQQLDRDILKLLLRRNNLLARLRDRRGQMDPREERALRASWEEAASRISRDPRLARQLFSLLQQVEFLPMPVTGEDRRPAFNLAPARQPVDVHMPAPLACRRSRLYLTLAAISGSACRLAPSLLNDPTVECIKMFNQCGTSLAWDEDGTVYARKGGGFTAADKVVFVGDDMLNFCLLLGQYALTPSRAKFTGGTSLKMANLTALRRFLPQLGVRMTCAVPHSEGLPVRVECSGILPDAITVPADIPADAITGLLFAAPFQTRPLTFHLDAHPARQRILEESVAVLRDCGVTVSVEDFAVQVAPGSLQIPKEPPLFMELSLAASLLALPLAAQGGSVYLEGRWPKDACGDAVRSLLRQAGVLTRITEEGIRAERAASRTADRPLDASTLPRFYAPLAMACAAIAAHTQGQCPAPLLPQGSSMLEGESFLGAVGLELADGVLYRRRPSDPEENTARPWTAPGAEWAIALALTAFVRPGLKLASPGVVTALYPAFWSLYNGLPCPQIKRRPEGPVDEKPVRRRILAGYYPGTESGNPDH